MDSLHVSLNAGAKYYWCVNETNTYGTSPWSAIDSFRTVPPLPGAPTLTAPANGATGVPATVTLAWDTSSWAAAYVVQVSATNAFALVNDTTVPAASRTIGPLPLNATYYWRVAGRNFSGNGPWSAIDSFTVSAAGARSVNAVVFKAAGIGYSGVLAVYSLNGRLARRTPFGASAVKADLLASARNMPVRGAYYYCFLKDKAVMDKGKFVVR